jgi:hypothetical protein
MKTLSCIDNYINGNLSDAKRQAKRISLPSLQGYMVYNLGWNPEKASAVATYLKHPSPDTFQASCDAT